MNKTIQIQHYHSPCGDLILGSYGNELCLCNWVIEKHQGRVDKRLQSLLNADYAIHASDITQEAARQLDEYFGRKRTTFDIPLLFAGTDFQKNVWRALLEIPYGQTLSYGANAISIFAPCHRVIGSNRSLTGYGGGIEAKKFLLELEQERTLGVFPCFL